MDGALVLFAMVGALGGILLGMGIGWFFGRREGTKSPKARLEKDAPKAAPPPGPNPPPALGLMLRRLEEGLEVRLDGVAYRQYATMPSDSRRRLMAYLRLVRDWMEGKSTREAVTAATPKPRRQTQPRAVDEEAQTADALSPREMVQQIDEILQRLYAQANLPQPVRIVSGLKGGVNILVGMERYASIEDVPDEQVKALVQRAVKIWESRQ